MIRWVRKKSALGGRSGDIQITLSARVRVDQVHEKSRNNWSKPSVEHASDSGRRQIYAGEIGPEWCDRSQRTLQWRSGPPNMACLAPLAPLYCTTPLENLTFHSEILRTGQRR